MVKLTIMPRGEISGAESGFPNPESLTFPAVKSVLEGWREVPRANDPRHKAFAEAVVDILDEEALAGGYEAQDIDSIQLEPVDVMAAFEQSKISPKTFTLTNLMQFMVEFHNQPSQLGMAEEPLKSPLHSPLQAADLFLRSMNYIGLLANNERLVNVWLKTGNISQLPNLAYQFPADFDKKEAWRELLDFVLSQYHLYEELEYSLMYRRVQTNIPGRYKGLHIPLDIIRNKIPAGGARWLNVGCSVGLGEKEELSDEPYSYIHAYDQAEAERPRRVLPLSRENYEPEVTHHYNDLIDERLKIAKVYGVDITGVHRGNHDQVIWVKACHYTSELDNQIVMERFDRLIEFDDPRLNFSRVDFSNDDSVNDFIRELTIAEAGQVSEDDQPVLSEHLRFNVVTIFTTLNQLSEEDRVKVINNALRLLAPGGVILIQDFAEIDQSAPSKLHFPSAWTDFSYVLYMIDPSRSLDPELLVRWRNGRCEEMIIPPDSRLVRR